MDHEMARLLAREDVLAARAWLEERDEETLELQRRLATIPAPTGAEGQRAAFVAERFRAAGFDRVRTDDAGNVLASTGGSGPAADSVVLAAHLDTVFDGEVALSVTRRGPRLEGPGIGDNARGLAALLQMGAAYRACAVRCPRPIVFAATVGEEGAGDLRGVKHMFGDAGFRPHAFIALDGPGMDRVVNRAIGSRRLKATFRGPGGHSWAAYGVANPLHAVGSAIARLSDLALPASPRTTLSVVGAEGGSGLNVIPAQAWFSLDLRSEAEDVLEQMERTVTASVEETLAEMNRRKASGTPPLTLEVTPLGRRPSGTTDEQHPLVASALSATRALGAAPVLAAASTDANVAISLGVAAVSLGAGGRGGDAHLETEWFENTDGAAGIVRALLVTLAVAGHR